MELLNILIYLGKRGALNRMVSVTTSSMGRELNVSQQSISRWLIDLEKKGLITRKPGIKGNIIRITNEGKEKRHGTLSYNRVDFASRTSSTGEGSSPFAKATQTPGVEAREGGTDSEEDQANPKSGWLPGAPFLGTPGIDSGTGRAGDSQVQGAGR